MLAQYLCFAYLAYIFQTARAQPIACTYSCPFADELGQGLVKSVLATPFESFYSNFECVYVPLACGVSVVIELSLGIVR